MMHWDRPIACVAGIWVHIIYTDFQQYKIDRELCRHHRLAGNKNITIIPIPLCASGDQRWLTRKRLPWAPIRNAQLFFDSDRIFTMTRPYTSYETCSLFRLNALRTRKTDNAGVDPNSVSAWSCPRRDWGFSAEDLPFHPVLHYCFTWCVRVPRTNGNVNECIKGARGKCSV